MAIEMDQSMRHKIPSRPSPTAIPANLVSWDWLNVAVGRTTVENGCDDLCGEDLLGSDGHDILGEHNIVRALAN